MSRVVGEDACLPKLSTSPGSKGTVVHVHYVCVSGRIDFVANVPPHEVSEVTGVEKMFDESSVSASKIGEANSVRTVSSDVVNIGVHGDFALAMALSMTEKGFPTAASGYDSYDSKSSSD